MDSAVMFSTKMRYIAWNHCGGHLHFERMAFTDCLSCSLNQETVMDVFMKFYKPTCNSEQQTHFLWPCNPLCLALRTDFCSNTYGAGGNSILFFHVVWCCCTNQNISVIIVRRKLSAASPKKRFCFLSLCCLRHLRGWWSTGSGMSWLFPRECCVSSFHCSSSHGRHRSQEDWALSCCKYVRR